jgi:S1-C subfamily serine protease
MQSPYTQASTTSSQATTTDQSISSNAVNQTNTQQNIVSEQTDTDLSAIVSEWKNRVAQVTCGWMDNSQVQGAATIAENKQYGLVAITNAHVESDQSGGAPSSCVFGIYGLGTRIINYDQNNAQFFSFADKGYDVAYIKLDATSFAYDQGAFQTYGTRPLKICRDNDVNIGDKILLLGYPWNGSKSSVTATQGIVSGFDGNYYVTDAKIDHGNSGGAAILIKKDCWLGIPSSAVVGSIESYGRIFKGSILLSD